LDDFWHTKYGMAGHGEHGAAPVHAAAAHHDEHEAHGELHIHMPDGSYFPILIAIGMFIMGLALITNYWVAVPGFCLVVAGLYGWSFEPVSADEAPPAPAAHPVAAPTTPRTPVATH
jgi:hypothetical protein